MNKSNNYLNIAVELLAKDPTSRMLGINLVSASHNSFVAEMIVREDMLNGHEVCHGGFMFTLADIALAFACSEN